MYENNYGPQSHIRYKEYGIHCEQINRVHDAYLYTNLDNFLIKQDGP